ncbi:hypothetical protein BC827DRAFT_860550 [Russula dissimulans]|nr:hypothetical protein BC827DRAFT_860550 [Russula dissimulans]
MMNPSRGHHKYQGWHSLLRPSILLSGLASLSSPFIYPDVFEEHGLSYEQQKSVLPLSTRWGFTSPRRLTLRSINPPIERHSISSESCPHALTQSTPQACVFPALSAVHERAVLPSLSEARQMTVENVVPNSAGGHPSARTPSRPGRMRSPTASRAGGGPPARPRPIALTLL